VLRLRQGDEVTVLDGAGGEYFCDVADQGRHDLRLRVVEKRIIPPLPWRITLLQALPKGKLFDTILQKATELGAHRIVPLLTERVVTQLDEDKAESKLEHWRAVVIEAIKQSGSAWLPEVMPPMTPAQFLARGEKFDLPLIGSLHAGARHPREWFRSFAAEHGRSPQTLCVWVGPEGDFTSGELDAAEAAGARPISLGRLVLRCDTAAICCLSLMQYEMQATSSTT
jgi:16S rRNA (uracil1498-N3)-methyltransferase